MAINVFAGARRIALAIAVAWVLGWLAYALFDKPYVSLTYSVSTFGSQPTPADICEARDASKYTTVETPKGERISVNICFIASRADNGSYLIPYREVVSSANPAAAALYAARKEAIRNGANADATRLTEYLLNMPISKSEPASLWMAGEYDNDVVSYMNEVANTFARRGIDQKRLEDVRRQKLWEQWKLALQMIFGGVAAGWFVTAVAGWIVRGFMGVPNGSDKRPA